VWLEFYTNFPGARIKPIIIRVFKEETADALDERRSSPTAADTD
jgi:hypothetical protein